MKFSKFDILYESIMHQINEGGAAMAHFLEGEDLDKLTRINRENVKPTIDFIADSILHKIGVTDDMWTAELGSTGKKDSSGDVDIAINMKALCEKLGLESVESVKAFIMEKLNEFGFKCRRVMDNIHFACPIQGTQKDGSLIQVDFFDSVDLEYTKLEKFSPSQEESKYKGLHRTELWRAMMKSVSIAAIEQFEDNDGEYVAPDGRTYPSKYFKHLLMMKDGFYMAHKSWLGAKGNLVKTERKDVLPREFLGRDFQAILDMLFGKGVYDVKRDLNSFETIWNNILFDKNFKYKNRIPDIVTTFYYECKKKDAVVPDEVQKWVDENGLAY